MSVIAEQTYKEYSNTNKDWFSDKGFGRPDTCGGFIQLTKKPAVIQLTKKPAVSKLIYALNINNREKIEPDHSVRFLVSKSEPIAMQQNIEVQFDDLATEWKHSNQIISDWNQIILHPCYQRIIGLGPKVIPYILKDLKQNGGHWSWALQSLTGENPVADEDAGKIRKITEAWLNWGKEKGFI